MKSQKNNASVAELQKQITKWKEYSECETPEDLVLKFQVIRINLEQITKIMKQALQLDGSKQ